MHALLPGPARCAVMGILNVTPDSFSDGGNYADRSAAVAHGVRMREQGADVVDVGGESTRPGSDRVDAAAEIDRVLPVLEELVAADVPVSVDTSRAEVAAAAAEAGASMINDVSGGLADPDMGRVVAEAGVPFVLMHWRGHSRDMDALAVYDDVVVEVRDELLKQVDRALSAGVRDEAIVLDPGLGFAKTGTHNWTLLRRLDVLVELGFPVLVGAARKGFLGRLLADERGSRPPAGRDAATAALSTLAADRGAWGVRVHDVLSSADSVSVAAAWNSGGDFGG